MPITSSLHRATCATVHHAHGLSWVEFASDDYSSVAVFCPSRDVAEATARAFTETAATKEKVDV